MKTYVHMYINQTILLPGMGKQQGSLSSVTLVGQPFEEKENFEFKHVKLRPDIGLGVRVFANGPGDLSSIPGRVIPKTQKMVLDASLLSTQHYKVRIKGKVEQSRKGVAPSPTHWCSSYRKGSLRVTLDYGRQLYFLLIYMFMSVCVWIDIYASLLYV